MCVCSAVPYQGRIPMPYAQYGCGLYNNNAITCPPLYTPSTSVLHVTIHTSVQDRQFIVRAHQ